MVARGARQVWIARSAVMLLAVAWAGIAATGAQASAVAPATQAVRTTAELTAAFEADGYTVATVHTLNTGQRGIVGVSKNVTLLKTGLPKRAYYFEGTGYQMGYLHGALLHNETKVMVVDYLDHFIPAMISWKFNKAASSSAKWAKLYTFVTEIIGDFFVSKSVAAFNKEPAGTFPQELLDEMQGIVDGAHSVDPSSPVTLDRIITFNYGMDFLSTQVFGGGLVRHLKDYIRTADGGQLLARADPEMPELLELLDASLFTLPVFCDAIEVTGAAHPATSGPVYARAFQLATANYFQDYQTMFVYAPTDGRIPIVSAAAPGLVGSITAMNAAGLVMGVDTMRSGLVDLDNVGINSALLIRATVHTATSTAEGVAYVAAAPRGCSYLYHMLDTSEDAVIIEAARYNASSVIPPTAALIKDAKLRAALPTDAFLAANSKPEYITGIFVRRPGYQVPEPFMPFNKGLFQLAGLPYNAADFSNHTGQVFPSFKQEDDDWFKIASKYFSPVRQQNDDVALVTNFAITPQMRVAQMTTWASLFPGDSMQWRYDRINQLLTQYYGQIDFELGKWIIEFLSPDRTPGYWTNTLDPDNPMSAVVDGHLVAADVRAGVFQLKGGYWADGWQGMTLPGYVTYSGKAARRASA